MTKGDAYKALCPYYTNRHCVADLCPKWRWEDVETCRSLTGVASSNIYCAYAKMTDRQRDKFDRKEERTISLFFCTHDCADRQGYCG